MGGATSVVLQGLASRSGYDDAATTVFAPRLTGTIESTPGGSRVIASIGPPASHALDSRCARRLWDAWGCPGALGGRLRFGCRPAAGSATCHHRRPSAPRL